MLLKNFWPVILWAIVIFFLSSTSGKSLPSPDWMNWVHFDKWVHAFLYFVLFLTCFYGYRNLAGSIKNYFLVSMSVCVVYGIGIELIQAYFLPDRSGDTLDAIANFVGTLLAVLSIKVFLKKWPWQKV